MKKTIESPKASIKIKLSVRDRIHFYLLSPLQGSRVENALSQSINKRIDFTPEEKKEMEIIPLQGGRVVWNSSKEKSKDFFFEPHEILLIQQGINQRDAAKSIPNDPSVNDLADRLMGVNVE